MNESAAAGPGSRKRNDAAAAFQRGGKVLLFGGGLAFAGWLIFSAGAESVARTIAAAGGWLPLVILLEMGIVVTDFFGARALLGASAASISTGTWARAIGLAYASSIILPAGRAAGEAVRAATLAPTVGLSTATGACSRLQACVLVGNAALSLIAGAVVWSLHVSPVLAAALLGNSALCALLTVALLWVVRGDRLARWLRSRFERLAAAYSAAPAATDRSAMVTASLLCCLGRAIQTIQYAVVLHAVGGLASPATALTAQGVHIVGATVGDFVPNQMGATEGMYRLFAPALGLAAAPARALSIALVMRLSQLALSAACFLAAMAIVRQPRSAEAP